jgi:hypothetical protein
LRQRLRRVDQEIILLFLCLSLLGCDSGGGESLGGNYYLNRDSSHAYIWKKSKDHATIAVEQQIVALKTEKDYVLILRKIAESADCYDKQNVPTIITHYSNEDEYWVIDLKKEREIGPLKEQAYFEALRKLGLPPVKLTAPSNFAPNTEAFEKWTKDCKKLDRFDKN